jgi:hypothetical protein
MYAPAIPWMGNVAVETWPLKWTLQCWGREENMEKAREKTGSCKPLIGEQLFRKEQKAAAASNDKRPTDTTRENLLVAYKSLRSTGS